MKSKAYPLSCVFSLLLIAGISQAEILFEEHFNTPNLTEAGWYDNTNLRLSTTESRDGTKCVEFLFNKGAKVPTSGGAIRKKFPPTNQIYISYYIKYSANWQGSNRKYHPHEFFILTNLDNNWSPLAFTHLTAYIEQNEGEPLLAIQDGKNIDVENITKNLTEVSEKRAVAGCNGDSDGYGEGACYKISKGYRNGKQWRAQKIYFQDNPGRYYKNDWHHIEAFFKLNSITNNKENRDGILKYWYDGQLVIDHSDVIMRTAQHPEMEFNQFAIGPYIGDGSPLEQTVWLDDLIIATNNKKKDN